MSAYEGGTSKPWMMKRKPKLRRGKKAKTGCLSGWNFPSEEESSFSRKAKASSVDSTSSLICRGTNSYFSETRRSQRLEGRGKDGVWLFSLGCWAHNQKFICSNPRDSTMISQFSTARPVTITPGTGRLHCMLLQNKLSDK